MSIIGGIIQIIVLLLPVVLAAVAARNTPNALQSKKNEQIDKAIADKDVTAINGYVHNMLGQLQNGSSHSG